MQVQYSTVQHSVTWPRRAPASNKILEQHHEIQRRLFKHTANTQEAFSCSDVSETRPISSDRATCRREASDRVLNYVFFECLFQKHQKKKKKDINSIHWFGRYLATRKRGYTSPAPSVVVVVVLGHEDVVLLQQRREVLADLGPDVQEGHHDHGDADESEGSLVCR